MRPPRKSEEIEAASQRHPMQDERPQWVKAMHAHFQETGTYRASDIQRVLGDPRKSVEGPISENLAAASRFRQN